MPLELWQKPGEQKMEKRESEVRKKLQVDMPTILLTCLSVAGILKLMKLLPYNKIPLEVMNKAVINAEAHKDSK